MRAIKLIIEYDGTAYSGWQVQPDQPTIQQSIETALEFLTGVPTRVSGAGRTDAGVHARGQVARFLTDSDIPPARFALALNSRLPDDICIRSSEEVDENFDPRRDCVQKRYRYQIINSPLRPALDRHTAWHIKWPLDTRAMQNSAQLFVGTHDFASFCNQECSNQGDNTTRTISRSALNTGDEKLVYEIEGRSFLYNMVRTIVGTLVDVGRGTFTPEDIPDIIAARDRARAGQGAPAKGLCLEWVKY